MDFKACLKNIDDHGPCRCLADGTRYRDDLAAQFEALGISRDELARIIKEDSHD